MSISSHNIRTLLRRELYEHRRLVFAPIWLGIVIIALNLALLAGGDFFKLGDSIGISIGTLGDTQGLSLGGIGDTHGISIGRLGDTHGLQIGGIGDVKGASLGSDGFLADLSRSMSHLSANDMASLGAALTVLLLAVLALFAVALGVALFSFGIACLFDERHDRSILFWKSLPISDTDVVAAKSLFALVIMPLIWLIVALASSWLAMLVYIVPLGIYGAPISQLFTTHHPLATTLVVTVAMPVYLLTLLPAVGWTLLCSATSRRHPALLAFGVPALFALLGLFGWNNPVWNLLIGAMVPTVLGQAMFGMYGGQAIGSALAQFYAPLASVNFWFGVLFGLVCLTAAAAYRHRYTQLV